MPSVRICTALGNRSCTLEDFASDDSRAVFIVRDIDAAWIEKLRSELKIELEFFAKHHRPSSANWTSVMGATATRTIQEIRRQYSIQSQTWHIEGMVSCDGIQSQATRISLWQDDRHAILLHSSIDARLHLPVSLNRGGLIIDSFSTSIDQFFDHQWHLDAVFGAISPATFFYLLAASTMRTRLQTLDEARQMRFADIAHPTRKSYEYLYSLRQEAEALRKTASMTLEWMPAEVEGQLEALDHETQHIGSPSSTLRQILSEVIALDKSIMESFTLLLSFASLSLSESSMRTSKQAQQLTVLAFVYVPLTFVTGVFGMNIYEINGSAVSAWVPVAALGVTLAATAMLLGGSLLQRQRLKTLLGAQS